LIPLLSDYVVEAGFVSSRDFLIGLVNMTYPPPSNAIRLSSKLSLDPTSYFALRYVLISPELCCIFGSISQSVKSHSWRHTWIHRYILSRIGNTNGLVTNLDKDENSAPFEFCVTGGRVRCDRTCVQCGLSTMADWVDQPEFAARKSNRQGAMVCCRVSNLVHFLQMVWD
jgi:hypothetical protein